jgi:hypothetical protein
MDYTALHPRRQYSTGYKLFIVESQFKVFSHLMSIFGVLAKVPYIHCINYSVLLFLSLGFYLHLTDKNSVPTSSSYRDLVFMLNPRAIICPLLVHAHYCLVKVSLPIIHLGVH